MIYVNLLWPKFKFNSILLFLLYKYLVYLGDFFFFFNPGNADFYSFLDGTVETVVLYLQSGWFHVILHLSGKKKSQHLQVSSCLTSFSPEICFSLLYQKYATFIPNVFMLPRNTMEFLLHLFCIMWHIHVFCSPLRWSRNQFTGNKGRRSYSGLHISIYCFALEKSFTLFKPQHPKEPISPQRPPVW